jgi:hypothetical protein
LQLTGGKATSMEHGTGVWLSDTVKCNTWLPAAPQVYVVVVAEELAKLPAAVDQT